jgi:phosphoribosyl-AMP cyclohydrolase / phosphoribosyl-ATP pyrophosphohydrolase
MTTQLVNPATLDFDKSGGLIPAVIQHAQTRQVLMVGWMNREALDKTLSSGHVTFFSRSRNTLWTKGETSGHVLNMLSCQTDCDSDTLLIEALPLGPTCHLGTTSCFGSDTAPGLGMLGLLEDRIADRMANPTPESYTAKLLQKGLPRMAQKVGEEGVEVALAAVAEPEKLTNEAADLLYHLIVLLHAKGQTLDDVMAVLRARFMKEAG